MNAAPPITLPCATVADWLKRHAVTKCPPGHALGISALERITGLIANTMTWTQRMNAQIAHDVAKAKRKRLRSDKKSRT